MSSLHGQNEELAPNRYSPLRDDFIEDMEENKGECASHGAIQNQDKHNMTQDMHSHGDMAANNEAESSEPVPLIWKGMEFRTDEEAWLLLYVHYSSSKGFKPRKHTTYKSHSTGVISGRTYVCSKEGTKNLHPTKGKVVKRKRDTRENCQARMRIAYNQKRGVWYVTQFVEEHSHQLGYALLHQTQKLYHSSLVQKLIACLHANGVRNSIITKVINSGATNDQQMVTNQQCHDQIRKIRVSNIGSECVSVIQQFQDRVKSDPMFFFAVELDGDLTFRNVFWADGRSRSSYLEFNDVVSFDVTYRTNKFSLPFAPFTGVNHHRQSTLFGCALLADEKEESFLWLFKQWLDCMFNKPPGVIITDQDGQICSAIKKVFPNTRHRYCSWHVNNHATENLGLRNPSNRALAEDYYAWYESESISESEFRLENLKTKYNLGSSKWLVTMYEKREHWVPVYMRDVFTAGMKSTQRSESINSFFDGYVSSMTPLSEFVNQYDKAVASRRRAEKDEDFATLNSKPCCESGLAWEVQAASFYTRNLYELFYKEFISSQSYVKEKVSKNDDTAVYRVGKRDADVNKWRTVVLDNTDGASFTCSCAKFETTGMLCRHIMAIIRLKQVPVIPEKYFLKRWSINARCQSTSANTSCMYTNENLSNKVVTPILLFSLQTKHHQLLEEASSSMSILKQYDKYLDNFLAEIMSSKLNISSQVTSSQPCREIYVNKPLTVGLESNIRILVRDPAEPVRTKGRPKIPTRIKSGSELSQKKKELRQNKCKNCGILGHNRAGCSLLKSQDSVSSRPNA